MTTYGYLLPTRGVVLSSDDAPTLAAKTESDVLGLARRAESLGFGSVWVGDSVLAKPRLEPLSTLAAVAAATDAVELGTAVHLPTLRHPVNVAHATATVDQLSGGRLLFGVGVGVGADVEAEYANLDRPYARRGAVLDELLDALRGLWSGGAVDHDGEFVDLDGADLGFQPAREPPVYVASAAFDPAEGFPAPIRRRIAKHADGWLPTGVSPGGYAAGLDRVRSFVEEAGRDPDGLDPACYVNAYVEEDEEAALEDARRFYLRYYPTRTEADVTDDWLREQVAIGPPDEVAARIEAYADAGVERFVVRFPASDQRNQLRRFASLVA